MEEATLDLARLAVTCARCGAIDTADGCDTCATPDVPPLRPPGSYGASVRLADGRTGILVGWIEDQLDLLTTSGVVAAPIADVRDVQPLRDTPTNDLGALRAARAVAAPELQAAVDDFTRSWPDTDAKWRQLLRSAVDSGDTEGVTSLLDDAGLPPAESTWWRLSAADRAGDHRSVIEQCAQLPPAGWDGRLFGLARVAQGRPELAAEVLALVQRHEPAHPVAVELADAMARTLEPLDPTNADLARRVDGAQATRLLAGLDGSRLGAGDREALAAVPVSFVDDLVDAGAIPDAWAGDGGPHGDHLALRLDPAKASLDAVIQHDHRDELLRRLRSLSQEDRRETLARLPVDVAAELDLRSGMTSEDPGVALDSLVAFLADVPELAAEVTAVRNGTGRASEELLRNHDALQTLVRHAPVDALPTEHLDPAAREAVALRLLSLAKDQLHDWDWPSAEQSARQVLAISDREQVRDEALNTVAVARYLRGDAQGAVALLKRALDGEYTVALQTNLIAVAHGLGVDEEAEVLAELMRTAPTDELRVQAARRGLSAWHEDKDAPDLPVPLRDGLRSLLSIPLDEPDAVLFITILEHFDEDWVARKASAKSVHTANRVVFDVFHARAVGDFDTVFSALKKAQPAAWANDLVHEFVRLIFDAYEESGDMPIGFAMAVLESRLHLPPNQLVVLTSVTLFEVARAVLGEGEPNDDFIGFASRAKTALKNVDDEDRDGLTEMLTEGTNALILAYLRNRAETYDGLIDQVNQIAGIPRLQLDRAEARRFLNRAAGWCDETATLMNTLHRAAMSIEMQGNCADLRSAVKELGDHVKTMRI